MKREIIIAAIALLIIFKGCSYLSNKPKTTHLMIIADKTDTLTIVDEFTVDYIKSLLPISEDLKQGAEVTLYKITDARYNESFTTSLEPHSELDVNEYTRPEEVEQFYTAIERNVSKIKKDRKPLDKSYVFHPLFDALNTLSEVKDAGKRQLVILSDLGENTAFYSCYKKKDFAMLTNEPEKLREKLELKYPIEHSLNGIEVCFVHRSNTKNDNMFHEMATFLAEYLSDHGAKVQIAGSINEIK